MRLFLTLLLLIFFGYETTFASNREAVKDSLHTAWENESLSDSLRLQAMRILIRDGYMQSDPDSAYILAEQLKQFAKNTGFGSSVTHAWNIQGNVKYMKGDISGAIEIYHKTRKINMAREFNSGIAASLNNLGIMHTIQGNLDTALKYYNQCLEYREKTDRPKSMARTLGNIGVLYQRMGNEEKHLEYLQRSLDIFEQTCGQRGIANVSTNLGNLMKDRAEYNKAISYFSKALDVYESSNDKHGMIAVFINISRTYSDQNMPEKAIEYCEKSLALAREMGDLRGEALALDHIGINQITTKELKQSKSCFDKSLKIAEEIGDPEIAISAWQHLGQIHFINNETDSALIFLNTALDIANEKQLKRQQARIKNSLVEVLNDTENYASAISHGEQALQMATEMNMSSTIRDVSSSLYKSYRALKNHSKALEMFELHIEMRDSISNKDNQIQVLQQNYEYQIEKGKALAEQERAAQIAMTRTRMERENFKTNTYITGTAALTVFLVLFLAHRKITHQRIESRRIKEMDRFKNEFFSNVTHDFKTPLTLIINPVERLLKTTQDPSNKEELSRIHHNANYLHRLINQLLEINNGDNQSIKWEPQAGDLHQFVDSIVGNFSVAAQSQSVDLQYTSTKSKLPKMFDPNYIETILYNLINNALNHTPAGGQVEVSVDVEHNADGNNMILCVKDTGPGIPKKEHEKVFNRYYTGTNNSDTATSGTGIGLAIVRELTENAGGSVKLKSVPGKGSQFTILLPVEEVDLAIQSAEISLDEDFKDVRENGSEPAGQTEKPLVMVVEDNADMRRMISKGLEPRYEVLEAINGKVALTTAKERIPDIIISDIMMPEMDGIQFAEKIKEDPATSHVPVILLTAKDSRTDRETGLESGAIAYLTKPFHEPELHALVANQIELRKKSWEYFEQRQGLPIKTIDVQKDEIASKLREFIRNNISDENMDIDTICRQVGLSRTQLYRKLKGATGKSVGEFLKTIRLEMAAEMLAQSELSISETAFQTGFSTHSHFSKSFAETFGMSPTEFIEQCGKS